MRLIDADLVIDTVNEFKGKNRKTDLGIKLVEEIVSNAPTVDAERHGHWFDEEVEEAGGIYTYTRCSACGEYALCDSVGQIIETPYCPWCSAKMDAKGEDDAD